MRWRLALVGLMLAGVTRAEWAFEAPIDVVPERTAFFHLESAGRKNVAVSGGRVAVVWEDDHDGRPACYLAVKSLAASRFGPPMRVSGRGECAEPTVAALTGGRFLLGWEEDGRVWVRTAHAAGLGVPRRLSVGPSAQLSLAHHPASGSFAAWAVSTRGPWQILVAALDGQGRPRRGRLVDAGAHADQSYPSLAVLAHGRLILAWEDRRAGHTRLFYAVSRDAGRRFTRPRQLNESEWRGQNLGLGRGTGVMRVALAPWAEGVAAVWADKRDFLSGYDVYGAFAAAPDFVFGRNEKVQDPFGDHIAQWHPAIAADRHGAVAVVWDDDRDGTPDLWLAWKTAEGWSDNLAVPGASGPGVQSDPSLALDESGDLHLVWLDKAERNAPSRLRYVFARRR